MVSFLVEMLRLTVLRAGNGAAAEVEGGGLATSAGLLSAESTPLPATAVLESPKSAIFRSAGVQRVGLTRSSGRVGRWWVGIVDGRGGCGGSSSSAAAKTLLRRKQATPGLVSARGCSGQRQSRGQPSWVVNGCVAFKKKKKSDTQAMDWRERQLELTRCCLVSRTRSGWQDERT